MLMFFALYVAASFPLALLVGRFMRAGRGQ